MGKQRGIHLNSLIHLERCRFPKPGKDHLNISMLLYYLKMWIPVYIWTRMHAHEHRHDSLCVKKLYGTQTQLNSLQLC